VIFRKFFNCLQLESQLIESLAAWACGKFILILSYVSSKEPLDIHSIGRRLEQETGTFFQRLYKTMQNQLVDRQYLRYYNQRIRFEVKSNGSGTVVPIVVEIPHN
jgi:hypothetical protein